MLQLLAERELKREPGQTPLEFATATKIGAAITITSIYNRVRFGGQQLSAIEAEGIEQLLRELETQAG
jgi:hypothetical protein